MSTGRDPKRMAASSRTRVHERGAILLEYAFLLTAVGIPVAVGIFAGGMQMLKNYHDARDAILDSSTP